MKKKVVIVIGIMTAAFFLLQPVAGIYVGTDNYQKSETETETEMKDVEDTTGIFDSRLGPKSSSESISGPFGTSEDVPSPERRAPNSELEAETELIINQKDKNRRSLTEHLDQNRKSMMSADPNIFVPEYDLDDLLGSADGSVRSIFDIEAKQVRFETPRSATTIAKTRAGEADLELTQMEWASAVNNGWSESTESETSPGNQPAIGGFMVGIKTTISVTVKNNNPSSPVSSAFINFSIFDYWSGIPLIKIPSRVEFSALSPSTVVEYDFTPPAAKILYIAAYIDHPEDPDTSNNGVAWYNMPVLIWTADLEPGGFGDGSQIPNAWTGAQGPTDQWHKTDSAQNQNSPDHTTDWSWTHDDEKGGIDTYDDSANVALISPKIDMRPISDGQAEMGDLREGYYYIFAVPTWAAMYTGSAEIDTTFSDSDVLYTYEYTDDDEVNWKSQYGVGTTGYIAGDWGTQGGTQPPGWYPNSYPFSVMVGDGSGGVQPSNGAMNWSKVQFRIQFDGDGEGDEVGPGYYADDFITWGYQHWLPPYNIGLSDIDDIESNGQPLYYPNVEMSFDVSVENRGEALTNVPVNVEVKDKDKNTVYTIPTKKIASLSEDEEAFVTFTWTPDAEGDYYFKIVVGDLDQDYTPDDNDWELKIYVRNPNGRILVVDDDNSMHNYGMFFRDVEGRMLDALDALGVSYNVYLVSWNATGPTKAIMDQYEAVIWLTGHDNEHSNYGKNPDIAPNWGITLKPEDQTELTNWFNEGDKNFWLISPGVLYDLTNTDKPTSVTGFLKDELCIFWCDANESTPDTLGGMDDALAEDLSYSTYGGSPPSGFSDRGGVIDTNCGNRLFYQNTARTAHNSHQVRDENNIIYFAFNFYYMDVAEERKDLAYRILHLFGMIGGIDLELDDDKHKDITFGETVSYKFKVINPGLIDETVKLSLESPSVIPAGWTVTLNDKSHSATQNELSLKAKTGLKYFYLNVTAPIEYLNAAGELDTSVKNTTAGSKIQFKIRVEEADYPEYYLDKASCKVTLGVDGKIKVSGSKTKDSIDISQEPDDEMLYVEYPFTLENRTNGEDDVDVVVTLENPDDITAEIYQYGSEVSDSAVSLSPRAEQELTVTVTAEADQDAGDYDTIFKVLDATSTDELYSSTVTTTIEQYYDIRLVQTRDYVYSYWIDPNTIGGDHVEFEFEVTLENHGNGQDTVTLDWDENEDSPDTVPGSWEPDPVAIYDKSGGSDEIDEITVPAFDRGEGEPGTATIIVKVTVPKEEAEGRFWLDLMATSGAPKSYINNLARDELLYEDNTTFQIELVLPKVEIDNDDSELRDETGKKIIVYDDVKTTTENTIEVYVEVTNTGSTPITDLEAQLKISKNLIPYDTKNKTVSLAPGETKNISWTVTPDEAGEFTFMVVLDPDDEIMGISKTKHTWSDSVPVEDKVIPEEDPKTVEGDPTIFLLLLIVIIAIVIAVVFFLVRRKKLAEDDIDDIVVDDGLAGGPMMPKQPAMAPGAAAFGGMRPAAGPGPDVGSLAPKTQKQLPPGDGPEVTRKCIACGENNPPQNKFCQGCGSGL